MKIEVQVPINTDPAHYDDLMMAAAQKHGYVLMRRSGMPVDFSATIVVNVAVTTPAHIALSAELYKLKEGETS